MAFSSFCVFFVYLCGHACFQFDRVLPHRSVNDKIRQFGYDKICAVKDGHFSPRRNFGQGDSEGDDSGRNATLRERAST